MGGLMSYLKIEQVNKTFGKTVVLDNISLDIEDGEFICFLGPSGCGKTTLLRIVAGLETQDSGRIIQNGQDISNWPSSKRDFGIVFQSYALFPNLTAEKNIAYGLQNKGLGREVVKKRVSELLDLVGLPEMGRKYPAQLSGGQQQRIALARALALSPGLLLLDEPLSALDAQVRASLRGELTALHRRLGITTIMVTHDQEEALTMADRIVVMDTGVIRQVGTPLEVYGQPATPFVANFVGVMNFIQGEVVGPQTVKCGEVSLEVALNGQAAHGPVTLALRPEDVRLGQGEGGNQFAAEVKNTLFLGAFYRLQVSLGPGLDLTLDLPTHVAQGLDLNSAARLPIHLPREVFKVYHG
jgi:iron(III) transport system ATP-binding protein